MLHRRHQIVLQDDPDFDPMAILPRLDELLSSQPAFNILSSQESANQFSQLSPPDHSHVRSASASRQSSLVAIDLPPSSVSIGSYRLPGDLRHSSPLNKFFRESDDTRHPRLLDEDDVHIGGIGLEIDGNGNLIGVADADPDLPPSQGTSWDPLHTAEVVLPGVEEIDRTAAAQAADTNLILLAESEELSLPEASALLKVNPVTGEPQGETDLPSLTTTESTIEVAAPVRTSRRRNFRIMIDEEVRVSRDEFCGWTSDYVHAMTTSRKRAKTASVAQARRNAASWLYGDGISHVGTFEARFGLSHPLAGHFAGANLMAHLSLEAAVVPTRNSRRKFAEAFEEEGEEGDDADTNRRVRRPTHEVGMGNIEHVYDDIGVGDDYTAPELGMDPAPALDDYQARHSSSIMPWSRPGSVAPPSSASRAPPPGSAQKSSAPSPLHARGGSLISPLHRRQSISDGDSDGAHALVFPPPEDHTALDMSSHQFWEYMAEHAAADREWIDFVQLADPAVHGKYVAAQAFLHVLTLATKGLVTVQQDDGSQHIEPFGPIRIKFSRQTHPQGTSAA